VLACLLNITFRHSEHIAGSHLSKMLDSLLSGFQAEAEAASRDIDADDHDMFSQHRTALEMYAFLLHWFCVTADKFAPKDEENGAASKPKVCLTGMFSRSVIY
jgi:condensin complex subunit 1